MEYTNNVEKMLIFFISRYENITTIKLQKAMLIADRYHWGKFGKSISGIDYVKADFGPVMSEGGNAVLLSLESNGDVSTHEEMNGEYVKREYNTDKKISDDEFSSSELEALNFSLETVRKYGTKELSEMTHDKAWENAKMREVIPYETAVNYEISDTDEFTDEKILEDAVENLGKVQFEY